MKRLIIAAIALSVFNFATAQSTTPAKKSEPSGTHVVKKQETKKEPAKAIAMNHANHKKVIQEKKATGTTATAKTEKKTTVKKSEKPAAVSSASHTKKDGTPDKRYKENKTSKTQHLKKNGTPDERFKENKKQ